MFDVRNPNPLKKLKWDYVFCPNEHWHPFSLTKATRTERDTAKWILPLHCPCEISSRHKFSATWLISTSQNRKMKFSLWTAIERKRSQIWQNGVQLWTLRLGITLHCDFRHIWSKDAKVPLSPNPYNSAPQNELKLSSKGNFGVTNPILTLKILYLTCFRR